MSQKTEYRQIIKIVHKAAQLYKENLVGRDFLYVFDNRYIEAKFRTDNFKHLTGVGSNLSAKEFYRNALRNKLSPEQIYFTKEHTIYSAQKKLEHICSISSVLTSESFMLEDITTKTAKYKFGSTDLNCTVCLNRELNDGVHTGNRYIAISLRAEDCFSKSQNVFTVTHIFSKPNSQKKYGYMLYQDGNSSIEALPPEIKELLSDDLTVLRTVNQ